MKNVPRVAIIYDRVNTFGGAERVLLALREAFPNSVLFTSVYNPDKAIWVGNWKVQTSFLQHVPFARSHHQWFGWLMPLAFESLDLSAYDVVISVTSEAAKGVLTKPHQLHLCYCLTPTRYLWSHTHEYEGRNFGWLKRLFFTRLREWDFIASRRPDIMIPISKLVSARIQKYYRREPAAVLNPPLENSKFKIQNSNEEKYFLVVSRLVPYKRVDLAIQACLKSGERLKIVGEGTDLARLKKMANGNPLIEFAGFVSQERLDGIYGRAKALICAQEEDFGIVSLEAQNYGVPVITYRYSGVAETIIPEKTGLLCRSQTVEDLCASINKYSAIDWNREYIHDSVQKFSKESFVRAMQSIVKVALETKELYSTVE